MGASGLKLWRMNQTLTIDPCLCPLCGKPNGCAMVCEPAEQDAQPCWCTREHFSAQLLQQVPAPAKDRACICRACVKASRLA